MIKEELMEGPEVDNNNVQIRLSPKEEIDSLHQDQLLRFFREGYGERWISDDNFKNVMIKNATEVLEIYSQAQIAAALLFDNKRISDVAVHPTFQGQGLGVRLFQEASKTHPDAWISVGIDAAAMLATITDSSLNFFPVDERVHIETLFKQTNRARDNFEVETSRINNPLLSERLAKKGIEKDQFTAFSRSGATHGSTYYQILFQNQP